MFAGATYDALAGRPPQVRMTAAVSPTKCVFDTDVLVGLLDDADAHHEVAVALVVRLDAAGTQLQVSAVNYGELLVRPSRDPARLMRAIDALRAGGFQVLPVDGVTATIAAGYRTGGVSLADGFALTAAHEQRASLATFDRQVRRVAEEEGVAVLPD